MKKFLKNKNFGDPTPEEFEWHIRGYCMLTGDDPFETDAGITDDEAARESWERHRNFIMDLQNEPIRDHHRRDIFVFGREEKYFELFQRPGSWWKYDAPEKIPNYWDGCMARPKQKKYLLANPKLLTGAEKEVLKKSN